MRKAAILTGVLLTVCPSAAPPAPEQKPQPPAVYGERYRPHFHFTARENWLNDPNGCVFLDGEYHLFFQHNPKSVEWGNMTWGHAVSKDLVHWKQIPHALLPDDNGVCFSGSAVVDWNNTAGFQTGKEKVIVAIYTSHGDRERQSIAFSNDRGRTWAKFPGNPVLQDADRDPKVFWHEPTKKWVMCLYSRGGVSFYSSPDLKKWTFLSNIPGFHECPDMFELPVDGNPKNTRWVLHGASPAKYLIGRFDGDKFTSETQGLTFDYGKNFYAAQTFSDIPKRDGRRIQIAWMSGGKYPGMPFNQQMSFPCELRLRTVAGGIRLCRTPVKEIETLYAKTSALKDNVLKPGENPLAGISGDLFDIEMEIQPGLASEFGIRLHGQNVAYAGGKVSCLGASADLPAMTGGAVKLRILVDRTSLEVFGNDGEVSMSSCFLPEKIETGLELYAKGGDIKIKSLKVRKLRSARETTIPTFS